MAITVEETLQAPITQEEETYVASQWKLMWWRFLKHKLAVGSTLVIAAFYLIGIFAEFFAIQDPHAQYINTTHLPPQRIHFEGIKPFVYGIQGQRNPVTFRMEYVPDTSQKHYYRFFVRGYEYKLLGLFPTDWHLLGVDTEQDPIPLYPLGADRLGRDMWSRSVYATRISLSIGLVGVALSLFLGILLGASRDIEGG